MGRAITMENDIDALSIRLKKAEDALARVIEVVDLMQEKSTKTEHIDLTEKKAKTKKEKKDATKKETNDEGSRSSNK